MIVGGYEVEASAKNKHKVSDQGGSRARQEGRDGILGEMKGKGKGRCGEQ